MKGPNIILVGFMGTGKTTVGKMLADRLDMEFSDMDDLIEDRTGRKISEIFATDGESFFRCVEREVVADLAGERGRVIGAGGGVVLDSRNIEDFSRTGLVVCLSAAPEAILERVEKESHRPLLEEGDKMKRITALLEKRKPLYDTIPAQIETTGLSAEQVAGKIVDLYREYRSG